MSKDKKKSKKQDETVVIAGIYHEMPDGTIAYTYGFGNGRVQYFLNKENSSGSVPFEEYLTWKKRRDLKDFPNARDPRLPYAFDLHFDLKYTSDLIRALQSHNFSHRDAVLALMADHGIKLDPSEMEPPPDHFDDAVSFLFLKDEVSRMDENGIIHIQAGELHELMEGWNELYDELESILNKKASVKKPHPWPSVSAKLDAFESMLLQLVKNAKNRTEG